MKKNTAKMQRIRVKGIMYGFKIGGSWIGVKTYRTRRPLNYPMLSFLLPVVPGDARVMVREAILARTVSIAPSAMEPA